MRFCSTTPYRLAGVLMAMAVVTAHAQPAQNPPPGATPAQVPGLPAPITDSSSGAIINQVPPTRSITEPIAVAPVTRSPAPLVPPVSVDPAAGVVPSAPGSTGPLLRPEVGRSSIDALQSNPRPSGIRGPANNATNSLSPADAAQRQLMIEREDRVRGLKPRLP